MFSIPTAHDSPLCFAWTAEFALGSSARARGLRENSADTCSWVISVTAGSHAFDLHSGEFDSPLIDPQGNPLAINGLWALQFGAGGANNGKRNHLFFTAGIADEAHGLFGFIRPGCN